MQFANNQNQIQGLADQAQHRLFEISEGLNNCKGDVEQKEREVQQLPKACGYEFKKIKVEVDRTQKWVTDFQTCAAAALEQ